MNINDLVTHYVAFRRTLGDRYIRHRKDPAIVLPRIGPRTPVTRIRLKTVAKYLAGTGTHHQDVALQVPRAQGLFPVRGQPWPLEEDPLADGVPKCQSSLVPYIYSRDELRRLLDAIPSLPAIPEPSRAPDPAAILLLLYGAGLRRGEALRLTVADVDLANSLLTIRNTKFFKSRLVPIGPDLSMCSAITPAGGRHTSVGQGRGPLLRQSAGKAIHRWNLQGAFERLREHVGVQRSDGGRHQPDFMICVIPSRYID